MERQRSAVSSLHDSSFHHSSESSESSIDPERCWRSMRNSSEEQLSDCAIPSRNASMACMDSANQEGHDLSGWSLGECSLSGAGDDVNHNVPTSVRTESALDSEEMQYESSNNCPLNNTTGTLHTGQAASGHLCMQSPFVPQDSITNFKFYGSNENDNDDCQIIECHNAFGTGSSNGQLHVTSAPFQHFGTTSGSGGYIGVDSDVRTGSSIDCKRLSWKLKTLETNAGESSGSGSSNFEPDVERGFWQATSFPGIPAPTGNSLTVAISASGNAESSPRNFRLGISSSHQQDCLPGIIPSTENAGGSSNVLSAHRLLRIAPISNSLNLGSFTVADNGSLHRPATASVRRSRPRWYQVSSSGSGNSDTVTSDERFAMQDEQLTVRSVSREISEHAMFIPVSEIGTSYHNSINRSLAAGNVDVSGRVASLSRGGSSSIGNSHHSSLVCHRNSPLYPRRQSEFVHRSSISHPGAEQNTSYNPTYSSPSSSSPEQIHFSGSANQVHQRPHSRSAVLLERHLGRSLRVPYPSRRLAAATEGRSRLVSEIRNVLDLIRRGEGLRVEDIMILDQSVFFGMADLHDRHRDMRLDVDNMSYEELLALEDRIGNVSIGLSEEIILRNLRQRKYLSLNANDLVEPCCICREEYNDGEDLGILECGHNFHSDCIKQWLMQKNLCPVCKTTGLNN
ncbi:ubiquitin-protein ligase [Lithospermum erythrorhizon]|uniref:RING-type E3 ubiquitin transferase n=1 Tax=Lithospermum erythrorhizon TaxID=34254 RepID=A0AAV3NN09_LITER